MKRFISVLMLVCIMASFCTVNAFADNEAKIGATEYATLQDALDNAVDGDTVVLLGNVSASDIITISKSITLDGAGFSLSSTAGRAINVDCSGNVTIQNLTVSCTGERGINVIVYYFLIIAV